MEIINQNKSLFLKTDVGKKYISIAKLCAEKEIEEDLKQIEKNEFPSDFSISKILPCKDLRPLSKDVLIEVIRFANSPQSTISTFKFLIGFTN